MSVRLDTTTIHAAPTANDEPAIVVRRGRLGRIIRDGMVPDAIVLSAAFFAVERFVPLGIGSSALTIATATAVMLFIARHARFYRRAVSDTRQGAYRRAALPVVVSSALFLAAMYVIDVDHNRSWLPIAALVSFGLLSVRRDLMIFLDRRLPGERVLADRVLLMGQPEAVDALMQIESPASEFQVVKQLELDTHPGKIRRALRQADTAVELVDQGLVDRVVLLTPAPGLPVVNAVVRRCNLRGVTVDLLTGAARVTPGRLELGRINSFATINVRPGLHGRRQMIVKRAFDVVVTAVLVVLFAPVMAAVAAAIKLDSKGPVLYRQYRLSRGGGQFPMLKFRSMVQNADQQMIDLREENEGAGPLFKMKNDPRVTRVGKFIRRTSIDELPQLFNVLRGQMSLVGPRPALPNEVDGWPIELFDRLEVLPGVTGLWQVSGRSNTSFTEYEQLDLYYVDNWSLRLDLSILAKTLPAAVSADGAY